MVAIILRRLNRACRKETVGGKGAFLALFVSFAISISALGLKGFPGGGGFWEEFEEAFSDAFKAYQPGQDVRVEMDGPSEIGQGGYGQWAFTFAAGSKGMAAGQAVAIAFRHVEGWGVPQSFDPGGANYVTASSSGDVSLKLEALNEYSTFNRYFYEYFPWQHITSVTITRGHLLAGQTIRLVFGDRSKGSPGFRAPSVSRQHALFLALVRRGAGGQFVPIPARLSVSVLPDRAARFNVVLPTDAVVGEPFRVILRAEDEQGNIAAGYRGRVVLKVDGGACTLPTSYSFETSDRGLHIFQDVRFLSPGIYRIQALDEAAGINGQSNPSRCSEGQRSLRILWGDFHAHSFISDGTGSPSELFKYARDVAGLDFFALTDHCYQMDERRWEMNKRMASEFNDPPRFVTFYGYEWSGETAVGGDHNIIYADPDLPLYRSNSYYEPKNPFIYSGPDLDAPHIVQLYKRFRLLAAERKVRILAFPSIRGRIANPQWNEPEFSPVVEVASEAGWYESWALGFLKRGHRLGFVGNGDDHFGRPGYGIADNPEVGYGDPRGDRASLRNRFSYPWGYAVLGSPLTAVLATDKTRQAIFDAIFARRCYATSGARIILDFRADGRLMGEEFSASAPPKFEASVEASAPIVAVVLKKDGEPIYSYAPREPALRAHIHHTDALDYKGHFYYVEVRQADGHRAVSSPIWID